MKFKIGSKRLWQSCLKKFLKNNSNNGRACILFICCSEMKDVHKIVNHSNGYENMDFFFQTKISKICGFG